MTSYIKILGLTSTFSLFQNTCINTSFLDSTVATAAFTQQVLLWVTSKLNEKVHSI